MSDRIGVLFVCMGNICRSPSAHGVFRKLVQERGLADRIAIDSAGTISYHAGHPPDARAAAAALRRGVDLSDLRARPVRPTDFDEFDYVLAMDRDNRRDLLRACPARRRDRVRMFLDFADDVDRSEVPDPYYGGPRGFEDVLDLVDAASRGLLADVERRLGETA